MRLLQLFRVVLRDAPFGHSHTARVDAVGRGRARLHPAPPEPRATHTELIPGVLVVSFDEPGTALENWPPVGKLAAAVLVMMAVGGLLTRLVEYLRPD